jgi:alcohol dehydrogenase class IV
VDLIDASTALKHPTEIYFGPNPLKKFLQRSSYSNILLVSSPGAKKRGYYQDILKQMNGLILYEFNNILPNPELSGTVSNYNLIRKFNPDCIYAVGGGSVIDTAKIFSRMFSQQEANWLDLDLLFSQPMIKETRIPVVAIPTTAGSGAELTPFATLWDSEKKSKHSIYGDDLYPRVAIVDPSFSLSGSISLKTSSGLDTVAHAFDSYWSKGATELTRSICIESLSISFANFLECLSHQDNLDRLDDLCRSSALAGLAISVTRTSLGHAISYPISLNMGVPHGIAASFSIPGILDLLYSKDADECLKFAALLGFDSYPELRSAFVTLLSRSGAFKIFTEKVSGVGSTLSLLPQMQQKGRFDNFYREVSLEELTSILNSSLKEME